MEAVKKLDQLVYGMFDESSTDGLSEDVYHEMVLVVSFLSVHYKDIPNDVFRDYLYTTMQILDIKDKKFPEKKTEKIPPKLLRDLKSFSMS